MRSILLYDTGVRFCRLQYSKKETNPSVIFGFGFKTVRTFILVLSLAELSSYTRNRLRSRLVLIVTFDALTPDADPLLARHMHFLCCMPFQVRQP
jgi:hypothetical protein